MQASGDDEVLITTIHQAKGREWEVILAGSLCGPDLQTDRIGRTLADHGVYSGEPADCIAAFDRARQHYVSFTRARHLLVLTASGEPQARFKGPSGGSAVPLARRGPGIPGPAAVWHGRDRAVRDGG